MFMDGNKLGVGFGTYSSYANEVKGDNNPNDANFAIEGYYDFQVQRQHHRYPSSVLDPGC